MHKAHQKALSTTATLEEEIEKLHRMKAHSSSKWGCRDSDNERLEERGRKDDDRPVSLANLQLADLPTLIHPLVEWGLKAETLIWGGTTATQGGGSFLFARIIQNARG